ncbi:MAG: c-type cytochrome [Bacteroidota bacterium]|nr:c-type cytochrome [Bacteroidota bacterium]MDP4190085.1 c-type cytochrome [Bacteroidota bacterium]MDP4193700.1 c-type cytochrome [Bacteroidota bacterium]
MTKTQIWVAAFLGLFLILFGISYITRVDNSSLTSSPGGDSGAMTPSGSSNAENRNIEQAGKELSAMALIKNNGCLACHGQDLKGSRLAPALVNLKDNWSRDELIAYLRNPSSFMDKDRLKSYKQKYSSTIMPSYSHIDIKDLGKIADYLIRL